MDYRPLRCRGGMDRGLWSGPPSLFWNTLPGLDPVVRDLALTGLLTVPHGAPTSSLYRPIVGGDNGLNILTERYGAGNDDRVRQS
jgi:hypothetical protein